MEQAKVLTREEENGKVVTVISLLVHADGRVTFGLSGDGKIGPREIQELYRMIKELQAG